MVDLEAQLTANPLYHREADGAQKRWVAVTGAGGFIGRHLVAALLAKGENVVYVSRSRPKHWPFVEAEERGQLRVVATAEPSSDELLGVGSLVMLAGLAHRSRRSTAEQDYFEINTHLTERTARAALEAGCRRYVYVSTIAVHGDGPFAEPIDETAPIAPTTPYGRSKWAAEQALERLLQPEQALLVRIRPPLVFAPDAPGSIAMLRSAIKRGLPLPFASIENRRSLVALADLIEVLGRSALHPLPRSLVLIPASPEPVSTPRIAAAIATSASLPLRLFNLSPRLLAFVLDLLCHKRLKNQLLMDFMISSSSCRAALGWTPRRCPLVTSTNEVNAGSMSP